MKKSSETIDKKKCEAWCDLLMALVKMAKDLDKDEAKYIKAIFSIKFGELQLRELETKNKQKLVKGDL